jgi:lipopolysaccharide/colanic/teichoic acid biosynthesis glycosyltransferase
MEEGKRGTSARVAKRLLDIAVSSLALILLSPIIVGAYLAVRLTSSGPVFFRQHRLCGLGREMEMLKFRTMEVNNDSDTTWSVQGDTRVTGVGRFLRKSCIDELPQLVNVLRGDMSLVGPRPERPYFSAAFAETVPGYAGRLRAPAGLTGWAQMHGLRGDSSIAERVQFDNYYIDHWSLGFDIKIIVLTPVFLVRRLLRRRTTATVDLPRVDRDEREHAAFASPSFELAAEMDGDGALTGRPVE